MVTTFEVVSGEVRPIGEAESLAAASAALPPGAYTTIRTYGGHRVLRLAEHVRRLEESAAPVGSPPPLDAGAVSRALASALRATDHAESRLRLTYAPPLLFVSVEPFQPVPESIYEDGAWCVTLALRRDRPRSKDTRFIAAAAGAYERLPSGAHEGLMLGDDGAILEGLSSNFFAVREGALRTEGERALPGVTRSLVLELAPDMVAVSLVPPRVDDLPLLSEAFITSTSRGLVPVVRVDDSAIGDGRPGPVTRALRRRFEERVTREAVSVLD